MGKELLVMPFFSNEMRDAGKKLLERLDKDQADVRSAFWLYSPENRGWELIIASPKVDSEGPQKYYMRIINVNKLAEENEDVLSLHNIVVTDLNDKIVQLFKTVIAAQESDIRFSRNAINGVLIEDAYIYRST